MERVIARQPFDVVVDDEALPTNDAVIIGMVVADGERNHAVDSGGRCWWVRCRRRRGDIDAVGDEPAKEGLVEQEELLDG